MVITVICPACSTAFPVDTNKVPEGGVNARCSTCREVFRVEKPEEEFVLAPPAVEVEPVVEVEAEPLPTFEAVVEAEPEPEPVAEVEAEPLPTFEAVVEAEPEPSFQLPPLEEPAAYEMVEEAPVVDAGSPDEWVLETEDHGMAALGFEQAEPVEPPAVDPTPAPSGFAFDTDLVTDEPSFEPEPEPVLEIEVEPLPTLEVEAGPLPTFEPEPVAQIPAEPEPVVEPAPPPPPPPEPTPAAKPITGFTFGKRDPKDKARRLARVLVSDMISYNPERHERALANGTLKEDFEEEIQKSWREYVEQVGDEMARGNPFWQEALNDVLAKGQRIF